MSVLIGGKQKVVLMSQHENRIHPCSTYHTLNDWTLNGRPGKDRCEHNTPNRLLKIGIFLSKNGLNFSMLSEYISTVLPDTVAFGENLFIEKFSK